VVIGGGSAGLVTATIAAALRACVTLVEQHRLGGDCLNTGCVPSKALIRSARLLALIRRAPEFGLRSAIFVDPELARVGLNEQAAQAQGVPYELTRFELADLDRAIADGAIEGFVKVLTVPGRDRILGVTIVGAQAGELLAEYVLAMTHGIGLNQILGTVHGYPTLAEANKMAAGQWRRAHAPQAMLAWAERWHRWRRG